MDLPKNAFKHALGEGRSQLGLWCTLASSYALEAVASAGFDWVLIDAEHSPNDVRAVLPQLQMLAGYPQVSAVVRPPWNDPVIIKRYLDIGAQTLLIPFVQSAQEARMAVEGTRYPPRGIRGVSAATRATRFGRVEGYATRAEKEICLLVQVETREALEQIEEIAAVDGIDGIFVGPGDLAASLGHPGEPAHPEVDEAVGEAVRRISAAGLPAGVLTASQDLARRYMEIGSRFTAVGVDLVLLAKAADRLAEAIRR